MGNILSCVKKNEEPAPEPTYNMFFPVDKTPDADSITIPSRCENPSFILSLQGSRSNSNESFKWSRMMSLIMEHEHLTNTNLTHASLRVTAQVLEIIKKNLRAICDDYKSGTAVMPEIIVDKFKVLVVESKNVTLNTVIASQPSSTNITPLTKKILVHLIALIYYHDVILCDLRSQNHEHVLNFLKQVAVSHALKGIMPLDFRMMDWFLINYLVKNQLVSEEGLSSFINYLNILSNHVARFYESQSIRGELQEQMIDEEKNDRRNKCRENYRIMKKWQEVIANFKEQEQFIEDLLDETSKTSSEKLEESVDTLTLKQQDCILKYFVQKPPAETTPEHTEGNLT